MNITIVMPVLNYRGGERIFYTLALGLTKAGHKVKIITARVEENAFLINKNIQLITLPKFINKLVRNDLILFFLTFPIIFFLLLLNSKRVDIINTESFFCLWASVLVGRIRNIKVVWTAFSFGEESPRKFSPMSIFYLIINFFDRFFIKRIDGCICVSPMVLRRINKYFKIKNISVIIPAIDGDRFTNPIPQKVIKKYRLLGKKILLLPAVLHLKKNQELAIRSLCEIIKVIPDTVLLLLGDGKDKNRLKKIVEKNNLQKQVLFTGAIKGNEISDFYAACDLVLFPSILESEGLGLVPLEALYNGKLPIVSSKAGVAEIIKKEKIGVVVEPEVEAFTKAILLRLQNSNNYIRMIEEGKTWVKKNLSIDNYTQKNLMFFEKTLNR